ncbi:restriction endonuclease subunit S [Bengtsoniella intestinalis]|uniref:restriction endonuclease subunit S n=1 Tax=Bengtsoniella intestinalis TaxID=3073143 RepID=UPI00391F17EA
MKILNKPLHEFSSHKYNRIDTKYWATTDSIENNEYVLIQNLFDVINGSVQTTNYSNEVTSIPYIRIGDMSYKDGLDITDAMYLNDDTEIKQDKILQEDDIIVATIGATVGKTALAKEAKGGTFSNNTVVLRKKFNNIDSKFYSLLLQADYYIDYIFGVVSQKAQPNLQEYDLKNIKVPFIEYHAAKIFIDDIVPIESEINNLKSQLLPVKSTIDRVISQEFELNIEALKEIDNVKIIKSTLTDLSFNNSNHRFSPRWNKAGLIQEKLIGMKSVFELLGNHIISTQNGWSPECTEASSLFQVLGIDAINKDSHIQFNNVKFSDIYSPNFDKYIVKDNDFFVSRGNTTDLVALASIATITDEISDTVFPDLMIRIDFKQTINKQYMAYIFNSFIGRLYFKYASKGKNQTMVKISKKELHDFYVPVPKIDIQNKIVNKIQQEINNQNAIKAEIAQLRAQIDEIIEGAIKN